ncbi:histidine phosphatase family protein [Brevibacterium antiquum]|uniref:histidine phosphatase family protein n=1 Tax=Brevibacterium antiquum TaxID=234835 RepID=UPI0018DF7878|nr:histidine phosphatase family protein [Brevibacterium antiquum]
MSVVYLVRHGQASFGTDDYDRLSTLGHEQARITGEHLSSQEVQPTRIVHGEMLRQRQTAAGVLTGLRTEPKGEVDAGWNEFDASELVNALSESDPRASTDSTIFQRVLEQACARWAAGAHDADYTETFTAFTNRVDRALDDVCTRMKSGESTVVVSSSGAIAWTAARLLGAGFDQWLTLNRVTINSGVTKIITGARGTSLISFNDHGHLSPAQVTYR